MSGAHQGEARSRRERRHSRSTLNGRKVIAPVLSVPGHPDNAVTVHLGYGRQQAGRVGSGVGFNAYPLRTSDAPLFARGRRQEDGRR